MTIHEPATFVTDCLLALLAAVLAVKLHPRPHPASPDDSAPHSPSRAWLALTLGLLALSALMGGAYHGFAPDIPRPCARAWWWFTLLSIHGVSAALGLSLLHAIVPPHQHRAWKILVALKLLGFASVAALHPRFIVAIADYGSTILVWLVAALVLRRSWWKWMTSAIALSAIAATVQQLKWAPSATFNHNDLYHVIQGLALIAFYRAGLRLDQPRE